MALFGGGQQAAEGPETPDSLPSEQTGATETLAEGEKAKDLNLRRGQYRAQFTIPADIGDATGIQNETHRIKMSGEMKRVHFYKVDAVQQDEKNEDGQKLATVTAVFRVIDNPIPLVPIAWGAVGLIGAGGSWLLFDKAETFVEETSFPIITTAVSIVSVLFAWYRFA